MEKKEIVSKLKEFNKYAMELADMRFVKHTPKSGYDIKWQAGKGFTKMELRGPDDEMIKAFVNDLRRFFQKNDTLRIHKLIPVYKSKLIEDSEKELFNQQISQYESFKKKGTNHIINKKHLTNEEVLEVFLYGRFSHRSKGTKDIHDQWEKFGPIYISLKNEFICILHAFTILINNIVYVNNLVLEKLK